MYAAALKDRIGVLPNKQFVQAWECIEAIDKALEKAGATAALALTYVRALREERLAQLLAMQEGRIAHLMSSATDQHTRILSLATSRNKAADEVVRLEKKLTRLTKKTKSKR